MMRAFQTTILIVLSGLICLGEPNDRTGDSGSRNVSEHNKNAVLEYLKPLITSSGKAIRLYYRAECGATKDFVADDPVPFPLTKAQRPSKGNNALVAAREIFANDKNVTVTEGSDGIIRIWIGDVPTSILKTKISRIRFEQPIVQYNPRDAIATIMGTREMDTAMHSLGFDLVWGSGGLLAEPDKHLPHLPSSIHDVRADEALDLIAKTWAGQGLVLYGACVDTTGLPSGGKPFWIEYVGGLAPVKNVSNH